MAKSKPRNNDSDIVTEARERYTRAVEFDRDNRDMDIEDRQFLANYRNAQWSQAAQAARQGRPMLTINRLPQFVKQVTGDIRLNKPEIRVLPVDDNTDPETAEIFAALIKQVERKSRAHRAYVKAAEHAVAGGIGWLRVLTEWDEDGFGQNACIEAVRNPLAVVIDPDAVKLTREEMNYAFVTELVDRKAFQKAHPDVDLTEFESARAGINLNMWRQGDMIRLAEYWTREKDGERTLALMADGKVIDVSDVSEEELALMAANIVQTRKTPRYVVRWRRMTGTAVIDEGTWVGGTIPLVPVIGEEIDVGETTVRHGLIRYAKDATQAYNFARSSAVETLGLAPKAPWLVTSKMVGDNKNMWDTANVSPRPYLVYEPDPNAPAGRPTREAPPQVPVAFYQEAQVADNDMKATTGIYDASLGNRSNETSGIAIERRENQGEVATFVYQDNLVAAIERIGRILIEVLPKIITGPQVVRLTGEDGDGEGWARINEVMPDGSVRNDISVGTYDIEVSTGPAYATKRQRTQDTLAKLMQDQRISPFVADLLAKALDLPLGRKIAERLERALPPGIDPEIDAKRQEEAQQRGPQQPSEAEMMARDAAQAELDEKQAKAVQATAEAMLKLIEAGQAQGLADGQAMQSALAEVQRLGEQLGDSMAAPQQMPGALPDMTAPDGIPG